MGRMGHRDWGTSSDPPGGFNKTMWGVAIILAVVGYIMHRMGVL